MAQDKEEDRDYNEALDALTIQNQALNEENTRLRRALSVAQFFKRVASPQNLVIGTGVMAIAGVGALLIDDAAFDSAKEEAISAVLEDCMDNPEQACEGSVEAVVSPLFGREAGPYKLVKRDPGEPFLSSQTREDGTIAAVTCTNVTVDLLSEADNEVAGSRTVKHCM